MSLKKLRSKVEGRGSEDSREIDFFALLKRVSKSTGQGLLEGAKK